MNKNCYKVMTLLVGLLILLSIFVQASFGEELKTLVFGLHGAPPTFDPANHRSRFATSVSINWTDALVMSHPDGRQLPLVAESITQIDPLTYEIKIRKGITFHNGDPLTADDVVFTYKRFFDEGGMEGKTSPRRSLFGNLDYVEKIDDYTVRAHFKDVYDEDSQASWVFAEILPKKYFEEVGVDAFIQHPIGCGPFKFIEGNLHSQVVLERYDDYWGGNPEYPGEVDRAPALDRLIIKFIPEPTTRIAALLTGELDIIQRVTLDTVPLLRSNPDVKVVTGPGTTINRIALNTTRPPFDDVRVRQAVAHAIDYEKIVEQLYLGYSQLLGGIPNLAPVSGSTFEEYHNRLQPIEYNPEKARALLEEAGATDIVLVLDTTQLFSEQAQVVAQMLSDVGIETSVRVWDESVIVEMVKQPEMGGRDAYLYTIGNSTRTPLSVSVWAGTGAVLNYSHYSNPDLDDLLDRVRSAPIGKERNEILFEVYEFLMEEVPYINLHIPYLVEATRSNVINYTPHYQDRMYMHRVDIE